MDCVGLTCGYLILFGRETKDFWLVNPITRHQRHFPNFPFSSSACEFKAIIVFSPSRSDWMFVVRAKGTWNNVLSKNPIGDILVFKGKIYTVNIDYHRSDMGHLCEMRFDPWPKLKLVKTRNFPKTYKIYIVPEFLSYGESLYVYQYASPNWCKVHELDVGEMKWVSPDKTKKEYEFFISFMDHVVAVKQELWRPDTSKNRQRRFIKADMWYFPHECLNQKLLSMNTRFGMEPKLMLLETENFPMVETYLDFVILDENLHVHKLDFGDFGEMKWVYREKTNEEYVFYIHGMNHTTTVVKEEWWVGTDKSRKGRFNTAYMWYFPHD
ncbi:hypothetical protein LXL04_010505 [Taraxacum kok-saghyz]